MSYDLIFHRAIPIDWSISPAIMGSDEPLVWTPGAVKTELMRILGIIDAVNRDVSLAAKEGKISSTEWEQWQQSYLTSHRFLVNASSLWGSNVMVARQHESQALKWRDLVASRGGTLLGPRNPGRKDDRWSLAGMALAVGGAVAGTTSLAYLISSIRK
jgi:hypothetical protein